ncbi:MAG: hypothetical protein KGM99_19620 [Burkholderiales bacterium]|nr:hypothetical protein [Burkholderiales bacterium]
MADEISREPQTNGAKSKDNKGVFVKMSQDWVEKNISQAVQDRFISKEIIKLGNKIYSRLLFYTPFYLPSALEHENALISGAPNNHESHKNHDIPTTHRHDELEVKKR